jgi:hypothetical protein
VNAVARRALIGLVLLAACSDSAPPAWQVRYSTGVTLDPPVQGREFSFDFPRPPGSVHYITRPAKAVAAREAVSATFTVSTQGAPVFDFRTEAHNVCDRPSSVRLLLQRRGDTMTGKGEYEFYRWWSAAGTVLASGTMTVEVPLKPALWISVFGKSGEANPAAFAAAMADLGNVGVTFGGGCFFGHGVRVMNGSATFTLERFEVR